MRIPSPPISAPTPMSQPDSVTGSVSGTSTDGPRRCGRRRRWWRSTGGCLRMPDRCGPARGRAAARCGGARRAAALRVGGASADASGHAGAAGISVSAAWSIGWPQVGQKTAVSSTSVPQFGQ